MGTKTVHLKVDELELSFGGVQALDQVSFEVMQGEIVGIIGPNGAGKTSVLNCISGFYSPQKGDVHFEGRRITGLRPDMIASLGISRTFQNIQLYNGLRVIENLMAARTNRFKSTLLEGALYFGRARREEVENRKAAEKVIGFLDLELFRNSAVGNLPYGIRKRVDLARALAQEPRLLLLDEPMAGMNSEEKEDMAERILDIQEEKGCTVIFIEHDMQVVMGITDRIVTLDFGRKIAEGTPDQIKNNPAVISAYLGEDAETSPLEDTCISSS